MKALRITRSPDLLMWYAPLVGKLVPYLGEWPESGYKSREPGGYTNVVRFADAEIVEDTDDPDHS